MAVTDSELHDLRRTSNQNMLTTGELLGEDGDDDEALSKSEKEALKGLSTQKLMGEMSETTGVEQFSDTDRATADVSSPPARSTEGPVAPREPAK
jgi:hypothetical protein